MTPPRFWTLGALTLCTLTGCFIPEWGPDAARWTGRWQVDGAEAYGGDLHCIAQRVGEQKWKAEFSGVHDEDETFEFQMTMAGKKHGDRVVFTGRSNLGKKNGGRYEWTGQIQDDTFTGRYVSTGGRAGSFELTRDERWRHTDF